MDATPDAAASMITRPKPSAVPRREHERVGGPEVVGQIGVGNEPDEVYTFEAVPLDTRSIV